MLYPAELRVHSAADLDAVARHCKGESASTDRFGCSKGFGQADDKVCAACIAAHQVQPPAVSAHQLCRDGKAKARAACPCAALKGRKQMFAGFGGQARAGIGHADPPIA